MTDLIEEMVTIFAAMPGGDGEKKEESEENDPPVVNPPGS